jgi:thymidine kinase
LIGKLTVITGPMYSGKTTALLSYVEIYRISQKNVKIFKPSIDTRYGIDTVQTHSGFKVNAYRVDDPYKMENMITPGTDAIFIDEIHFFPPSLADCVKGFVWKGMDVYCSGLDMSYLANPFETTARLMALADTVVKKKAVCHICHRYNATMSYKTVPQKGEIDVGGMEKYVALCKECYAKVQSGEFQATIFDDMKH